MNTKLVFNEFLNNKSIFINEIARTTKISAPTVIKIVDYLLKEELIKVAKPTVSSIGRRPNMLKINVDKYFFIGVIYEGESLMLGIVDLNGKITNFIQIDCKNNFEESLYKNIDNLLKLGNRDKKQLMGIGIGIPCIFNKKTREIIAPLIGYKNKTYYGDVIDRISNRYNAKVIIDNELNIQAIGEFNSRKLTKADDLIFISLGTGLGAGIILDGKIRRGASNFCGEIGYSVLENQFSSTKSNYIENIININHIKESFDLSDSNSKSLAMDFVANYLAMIINNVIVCLDISNIVLDGRILDLLGNEIINKIQGKIDDFCINPIKISSSSTVYPGVIGGAVMARDVWLDEIFSD